MNEHALITRHKIQLGGLVIQAGLEKEEMAVILGALALAAKALKGEKAEAIRAEFREVGKQVFPVARVDR